MSKLGLMNLRPPCFTQFPRIGPQIAVGDETPITLQTTNQREADSACLTSPCITSLGNVT